MAEMFLGEQVDAASHFSIIPLHHAFHFAPILNNSHTGWPQILAFQKFSKENTLFNIAGRGAGIILCLAFSVRIKIYILSTLQSALHALTKFYKLSCVEITSIHAGVKHGLQTSGALGLL